MEGRGDPPRTAPEGIEGVKGKAGRLKDSGQEKATPGKNNKILLFPLCPAGRQGKSLKAAVMRFWKGTEKNFLPFMTKILPVVTKGLDKSGKCGII